MTISLGQSATPSDIRIYAIGDVHGHLDLLTSMHQLIKADLKTIGLKQHKIVFLGDYIDRGPDSSGCVQYLIELISEVDHVICLKGNHEQKLENFLKKPLDLAGSFFGYGGTECAISYGIDMADFNHTDEQTIGICAMLDKLIPSEHKHFYANLAKSVTFGDYFFSHAGVRPGVSLDKQTDDDLMHIRSEFISHNEPYEKVVVHGHTPAYPMEILPNRINVDTCAYDTGVLSCLVLEGTSYKVIEAN